MYAWIHARFDFHGVVQKDHIFCLLNRHRGINFLTLLSDHTLEVNYTDRVSTPINFYRPITPYSSLLPRSS